MAHVLFADLTQAGVHTLRRAVELGHTVTFVRGTQAQDYLSDDAFLALLALVDEVVEIDDTADTDLLTETIRSVHGRRPVDAVMSQCDPMLEALAVACERLGLAFTSSAGIRNVRNKARARQLLADAGLATAAYSLEQDVAGAVAAARRIGYPVVVKPASGLDSLYATRAETPAEVARAAGEILAAAGDEAVPARVRRLLRRGILVEEYLAGELVSAEIGMRDGRCHRFLVCGRSRGADNDCVEVGAVLPADVSAEESAACFDYAAAVCRATGLDLGVFHVEIMLTATGPVLVEVNPRVMGGVMPHLYHLLTGVHFGDFALDLHLGRALRPAPTPPERTITARRLMPRDDLRLPEDLDLRWLTDPGVDLASFENFSIRPGAQVRRQQVIGRFAVLEDSWLAAMERANQLVHRFEEEIGIPLVHPAPVSAPSGVR
ncbi:MAG TPA: ATP-grasp domain-containing protein [Micromonosporaceae bacterium]|nr:ATP-grasp domain-containing protein [Micromonosporaceae bacterium]